MAKFHSLRIKDIVKETADCVSITFDIPEALHEEFVYKQGQYLTLKVNVKGEELRRSYSICSSPAIDKDLRIAVKKVDDGRVSAFLNNGISSGTSIEVMKPMGNFYTPMNSGQKKTYVAFAAGSGITPVISLIKTALHKESESTFILFYGNRNSQSIIFKSELDDLENEFGNRFRVHYIFSREENINPLYCGRMDAGKCEELANEFPQIKTADEFFICGPFEMIKNISSSLALLNIDKEHIHYELFTNEPPPDKELEHEDAPVEAESKEPVAESKVTIVLDGEETEITVKKGTSILDTVLDAGLDAPYACTGGSCCTCRAKVMEGSAIMDVNYALTDKEVEEGYILTCQSHPTTPKMIVDYDEP